MLEILIDWINPVRSFAPSHSVLLRSLLSDFSGKRNWRPPRPASRRSRYVLLEYERIIVLASIFSSKRLHAHGIIVLCFVSPQIKALLALMRKMIAHSGSAPSGKSHVLANDDVSALVEEKLRNISSMIPQYNASLEQVTRLAKDAAETSTAATGGSAASPISRASLSSGNGITTETKREDSMGNDEGAWDSLVQKISFSD